MPQGEADTLLSSCRVLDLTDEKGVICGKILGDLGADVIKIERPGGDHSRRYGPFYHDIPHPENSLHWFAFNANKRGITLNIESKDGQEILKRLVKSANFIIESSPPGYMDKLGLGYSSLSEINPGIIMISITPFGQTGPYKDLKISDLVVWALSGYLILCGDADMPPVRISCEQAYLFAGAQAAAGAMIAFYHRQVTGEGQQVDVSIQESLLWQDMQSQMYWNLMQIKPYRVGPYWVTAATGNVSRLIWECKDGYVTMPLWGGSEAPRIRALVNWMDSEGMAADFLKEIEWETAFDLNVATQENIDRVSELVGKFLLKHTVSELFEGGMERGIQIFPVSSVKDIKEDPQLAARDFWVEVEHPELGCNIIYPGAFAKSSATRWRTNQRAPLIGEHNKEIYQGELGFSKDELVLLKQGGVI